MRGLTIDTGEQSSDSEGNYEDYEKHPAAADIDTDEDDKDAMDQGRTLSQSKPAAGATSSGPRQISSIPKAVDASAAGGGNDGCCALF